MSPPPRAEHPGAKINPNTSQQLTLSLLLQHVPSACCYPLATTANIDQLLPKCNKLSRWRGCYPFSTHLPLRPMILSRYARLTLPYRYQPLVSPIPQISTVVLGHNQTQTIVHTPHPSRPAPNYTTDRITIPVCGLPASEHNTNPSSHFKRKGQPFMHVHFPFVQYSACHAVPCATHPSCSRISVALRPTYHRARPTSPAFLLLCPPLRNQSCCTTSGLTMRSQPHHLRVHHYAKPGPPSCGPSLLSLLLYQLGTTIPPTSTHPHPSVPTIALPTPPFCPHIQ